MCTLEGGSSNLGEVGRQFNLDQGRALVEGGLSNRGEGGRQRDLAQGRTLVEGPPSDLGEVGRQCDLGGVQPEKAPGSSSSSSSSSSLSSLSERNEIPPSSIASTVAGSVICARPAQPVKASASTRTVPVGTVTANSPQRTPGVLRQLALALGEMPGPEQLEHEVPQVLLVAAE